MNNIVDTVKGKLVGISLSLGQIDPLKLVLISIGSTWAFCTLKESYDSCEDGIIVASKKKAFRLIKKLPWVKREIKKELEKSMTSLKKDVDDQLKGLSYNTQLPDAGLSKTDIVKELQTLLGLGDFKAETGALSGVCHQPQDERVDVVTTVYSMSAYTNPLNPDAYPGKSDIFKDHTLKGYMQVFVKWRPKLFV